MRVQPTNLADGVAHAARVVGAFVQGGAIAAFLWLTARWITRRPVKLQDPGSIYVLVLSLNLFLALVGGIIILLIIVLDSRPNGWSQWVLFPSMIAGALLVAFPPIYGAIRAREWPWKIIFVCDFLKYVLVIFHISLLIIRLGRPWSLNGVAFTSQCISVTLQAVIMISLTTSVVIDWRRKTPRHWLHYFGIGLLALSIIQFLLQQSPKLAELLFFP
jgi:hypothetical protein